MAVILREGAPIFRFLDSVGDGSGTHNAIGDYSVTPVEFAIRPPPDGVFVIERLTVFCRATKVDADSYGDIAGGLLNGLVIRHQNNANILNDLTNGTPVKTTADWGAFCRDVSVQEWGAGDEFFTARWAFIDAGQPLVLRGDRRNSTSPDGERLAVILSDDLTTLKRHTFHVQGWVQGLGP